MLTGSTTPSLSGSGSNNNKGVIHTLPISRTGAPKSDAV